MVIDYDGKTYKVDICVGFVLVYVPLYDCDGAQRTIDFPRMGYSIYGSPKHHVAATPYVRTSRKVAKAAIAEFEYSRAR